MKDNRLAEIRRAWRGSSSRFYSPALWMSDEELEAVAARVRSCSVATIRRAVETAEAGSNLLERMNGSANGENHHTTQTQSGTTGNHKKVSVRTLKIERIGDFWARDIKPRIRLCGQWLEQAGFKPDGRVEVTFESTGDMRLKVIQEANTETSDKPRCVGESTKR
jgi:hypothetical protein